MKVIPYWNPRLWESVDTLVLYDSGGPGALPTAPSVLVSVNPIQSALLGSNMIYPPKIMFRFHENTFYSDETITRQLLMLLLVRKAIPLSSSLGNGPPIE